MTELGGQEREQMTMLGGKVGSDDGARREGGEQMTEPGGKEREQMTELEGKERKQMTELGWS